MSGRSLAIALALVPAYGLALEQVRGGDPRDDNPPVIVHAPITTEQPAGVAVAVEATVTDESAVTVVLGFRTSGAASFESLPMLPREGAVYAAEIPAASVVAPGVEYFIAASDASALHNAASDPDGAPSAVHGFPVSPVATTPTRPEDAAWASSGGCAAGGGGTWSLVVVGLAFFFLGGTGSPVIPAGGRRVPASSASDPPRDRSPLTRAARPLLP